MDYPFILYILVSVAIVWGGAVVLIQADRTTAGFLFVIGSILVLVYYGLRWFSGVSLKATQVNYKSWPPVINMCPDFLTMHKRRIGNRTENVCIDLVGVSNGGIQKMTDISRISNNNFVFNLHENLSGTRRIQRLCQECNEKKVTWEGVWDGSTCIADTVPNPNGKTDGPGSC